MAGERIKRKRRMRRTLISLICVTTVLAHTVTINDGFAAQPPTSVQTRDGLQLNFDAGGNVTELRVEQKSLPLLGRPSGFFVSDVARSVQNVMPGGDFAPHAGEKDERWGLAGAWKIVDSDGGNLARAVSTTTQGSGNVTSPRVPVVPGRGYLLTARVRTSSEAEKFCPGLYVLQHDADGNLVKAPLPRGEVAQIGVSVPRAAQGFVSLSKSFVAQPRTATVQVYANIYRSIGRFDLDDVRLEPLESKPTRVEGTTQAKGEAVVFMGSVPNLNLDVEATFMRHAEHIAVDGVVRDTTGRDRALRVEFRLPVDARGWNWWDDIAESRQISGSTQQAIKRGPAYANSASDARTDFGSGRQTGHAGRYAYYGPDWSPGAGRQVSVFPFSSVTGKGVGLSLAQRVDQPRFFRIFYDRATGYSIDYNLGLAAETEKFPSSASFHFLIYRHDPNWGMRAAAQRFYDIFPEHFTVRAQRQGLYCYDVPVDLPNPEDFGFCFDLAGFTHRGRKPLQDRGVYLLVHPMGTEAHLRRPKDVDWGPYSGRPSLKQIEDIFLDARPEYKNGPNWRGLTGRYAYATFEDNRQRVVNSAVHGPDGRFRLYPYSDTIQFVATSCDSEIPSPNMAEGERKYYIDRHVAAAASAGSAIDGVDFDNIVLHAGRTSENFRRDHFRFVDHPLIYDFRTRRVCIQTGINFYEFVKQIADEMHAQGKLCTGNLGHGPHTQAFFGHLLDKHGGEITHDVPTRVLRGNRMMAYQKPVSHIVYRGAVAAAQEETVMHRWLAFGHFPAITELAFTGRGSDFEKGRPLYKKFMPVMQRIARAGWEPITHARVNGDRLFVERFGNWIDGDLHFTVHNDSTQSAVAELTVDRTALAITGKPAWQDLLSARVYPVNNRLRFKLEAHSTQVFAVSTCD